VLGNSHQLRLGAHNPNPDAVGATLRARRLLAGKPIRIDTNNLTVSAEPKACKAFPSYGY
jgi:hypothetical protein